MFDANSSSSWFLLQGELAEIHQVRSVPRSDASHSRKAESEGHIANVIITIGLNEASEQVQVQALEVRHRTYST